MPPKVERRKYNKKNWSKKDKLFIAEIKRHMELYHGYWYGIKYSRVMRSTWKEVSEKLNSPAAYCKLKWNRIKYTYAKLNHMIRIGRVTVDMVREHEKTSKYLDGSLDFLNPSILETPDWKLPSYVHTFFDSVFGENTNSDLSVDAEKLIKVEGNNYIEVIEDYTKGTGIEPTSILPNDENYDSDNSTISAKEAIVDFAIKKELCVERNVVNDLNDEEGNDLNEGEGLFNEEPVELVTGECLPPITLPEDETEEPVELFTGECLPPITLPEDETNYTLVNDNVGVNTNEDEKDSSVNHNDKIARFLVNYKTAYQNQEKNDLNNYMQDLAEVLCCRLAPENRKQFLSQIDLIVSELLEGT